MTNWEYQDTEDWQFLRPHAVRLLQVTVLFCSKDEVNAFQSQAFWDVPVTTLSLSSCFTIDWKISKKLIELWITALRNLEILKWSHFASDLYSVATRFNYMFADYFMPRHGPCLPHSDFDAHPTKPCFSCYPASAGTLRQLCVFTTCIKAIIQT